MLKRIKQSRVEVLRRFIEEKARSHSAVLTAMSAPIVASFDKCGNISDSDWLVHRILNTCRIVLDEYLFLISLLKPSHSLAHCSRLTGSGPSLYRIVWFLSATDF